MNPAFSFSILLFPLTIVGLCAEPEGVQNELIPLRLKEMERPDRLPESTRNDFATSDLALDVELPNDQPGESWPGEQFSEVAQSQLSKLTSAKNVAEITTLLAKDFRSSELESASPDKQMVHQGDGGELQPTSPEVLFKKIAELGKLKIKIITAGKLGTQLHVEANRDGAEYSATWQCLWEEGSPPRLASLKVESFETVFSSDPWFVETTQAVIGSNPRFEAQVLHGIEYWSQRITRIGDLAMSGHHGIAIGDVNGDGLEDLYVCDGGSLPNQLYLQQPDGTAKEVAAEWGVAWLEDSRGALLVDLDNDGDQDLVVSTIAMIAIAENNGAGNFVLRGGYPGAPYPFSLSAADYDSDGDLDLYTCIYSAGDDAISGKRGFEAASPIPFNDAQNGGRNVLLANLGDFRFGDVTHEVGLDQDNTRWSFAAAWEDFDRDGDPDLYVANDFGRNCFYRNDQGKFTNIAREAGVEDIGAGMSVSWGDPNRDGAADLHVGNMFSSAGRRVASQRQFEENLTRMARGNSLFQRSGEIFQEVSESAGIVNGGWAWSSALADLDNDGWQDIVVTNGYLTNTRDDDL
ncbi:VCBS repeat-containing protein [Verrucomicrobiaceae bacterium 227]